MWQLSFCISIDQEGSWEKDQVINLKPPSLLSDQFYLLKLPTPTKATKNNTTSCGPGFPTASLQGALCVPIAAPSQSFLKSYWEIEKTCIFLPVNLDAKWKISEGKWLKWSRSISRGSKSSPALHLPELPLLSQHADWQPIRALFWGRRKT